MKKKPGRKPTPKGQIKWDIKRRLEYIEFHTYWEGPLARKHFAEVFGISLVQASKDISLYKELAPENLDFDSSSKRYILSSKFSPKFITTDPQVYLAHLSTFKAGFFSVETSFPGQFPRTEIIPVPFRKIDRDVLRKIILAIRQKNDVEVQYQSMSNPEPLWRWIAPHSFNYDGFRWHARAFCHMSKTYKDFLLARILEAGDTKPSNCDPDGDTAWNEKILIKIGPNPDLPPGPRRIIEFDYDMQNGINEMYVRKASLLYFYRNLRFDIQNDQIPPSEQQIILLNKKEVDRHLPNSSQI